MSERAERATRGSGVRAPTVSSGPGVPGMEYKDYYAVLGVPRAASQADIKKTFRKLARQHHPDAKPGDAAAERRFKEVNEANEVLGDPIKRKQYDELGANWEAISRARAPGSGAGRGGGSPFAGFSGAGGAGGNVRYEFRTSGESGGFSDFFRIFFGEEAEGGTPGGRATGSGSGTRATPGAGAGAGAGGSFEDILAGMGAAGSFGAGQPAGRRAGGHATGRGAGHTDHAPAGTAAGRSRHAEAAPPAAAEALAEINLGEAYRGTSRVVEVDGKRFEVKIPAGADSGTRIRLTGKAPGGGDLFVVVDLQPDTMFTRRGADLERELPLTLEETLLGAEVKVETLKGKVLLTIPAGTQTGQIFRLTGQGMPRMKTSGHGDLYVRARVIQPTNLSDEAKQVAHKFFKLVRQPDPR